MHRLALFVAQGFWVGRIPVAPGTFGSVLGIVWFALLLRTANLWIYLIGTLAGLLASVWLCGIAENVLKRNDPGSVVLDEIAAMPICFLGWMVKAWITHHRLPSLADFFGPRTWYITALVFVSFR